MKCVHEIDDWGECGEEAVRFFIERGKTILRGTGGGRVVMDSNKECLVGFCSRHIPWAIRPGGEFQPGLREISHEEAEVWEVQDM
jgi:hypothetical protein